MQNAIFRLSRIKYIYDITQWPPANHMMRQIKVFFMRMEQFIALNINPVRINWFLYQVFVLDNIYLLASYEKVFVFWKRVISKILFFTLFAKSNDVNPKYTHYILKPLYDANKQQIDFQNDQRQREREKKMVEKTVH